MRFCAPDHLHRSSSLGVATHVGVYSPDMLLIYLLWFAEKMAFVGFKGSFRPVWVKLVTNEDSAKIYQALPIPVVKKMKLWGRKALPSSGCQHCPTGMDYWLFMTGTLQCAPEA